MKRIGYIYEQMVSVENCKQAILNASKGKTRRSAVKNVLLDIDSKAVELSLRLQALDFTTPYRPRTLKDGLSGKTREIQVPAFFPDQCAHHAIVQVIAPYITASMYYWSCANTPGKGIDLACIGVERATRRDKKHAKYCVQCDIRKFYPSIPHDLLKMRLRKKFKDEKALAIIDRVIDSYEPGLPIGNYTSPWLAEFYLQPLDNFIKQTCGAKHYVRYADDIVIIGSNRRQLRRTLNGIISKIRELGLEIKHNYQLYRIHNPDAGRKGRKIDFVGKCFSVGYTTVRKRRALAFMRQSRKIRKYQCENIPVTFRMAAGFLSRSACLLRVNAKGLSRVYYEPVDIEQLKEVIRNHGLAQRRKLAG